MIKNPPLTSLPNKTGRHVPCTALGRGGILTVVWSSLLSTRRFEISPYLPPPLDTHAHTHTHTHTRARALARRRLVVRGPAFLVLASRDVGARGARASGHVWVGRRGGREVWAITVRTLHSVRACVCTRAGGGGGTTMRTCVIICRT